MEEKSLSKPLYFISKLNAIIRLTRWREHVPYTIPLVLTGALLAVEANNLVLSWHSLAVIVANILAMCFAFMINDLEDAPDDARHPVKRAHNVISSGLLSYREGMVVTIGTFFASLGLFAVGGWKTLGAGGITLTLCYLYSVKPFRLKSRPIVDVLSHVLMLAGLLMLSGYLIYDAYPNAAWFVIAAVTLISTYGQFYNQLDDFETDKLAKLNNTASLLGERLTRVLMLSAVGLAIVCFGIAFYLGLFPLWLGVIFWIVVFTLLLFRWEYDMRGNAAKDVSGTFQQPILVAANILVLIWAAGHLGLLANLG